MSLWVGIMCLIPMPTLASAVDGGIDAANFTSPFLDNLSNLWDPGTSNKIYWNTPPPYEVHVFDDQLAGYVWGDAVGWISLNCSNTASCASGDFKVVNDGEGNLSGYAWGENAGWISFSCANLETDNCAANADARVVIGSEGEFSGYAWAENFGWIKFDCGAGSAECVKTDWRPLALRAGLVAGASGSAGVPLSNPLVEEVPGAPGTASATAPEPIDFPAAPFSLSLVPPGSPGDANLFDIAAEPVSSSEPPFPRRWLLISSGLAALLMGIFGRALMTRFWSRRSRHIPA